METRTHSTTNKNKEARHGNYQWLPNNGDETLEFVEQNTVLATLLINQMGRIKFQQTIRDGKDYVNGTPLTFADLSVRGARPAMSAEDQQVLLAAKASGLSTAEIVEKLNALAK